MKVNKLDSHDRLLHTQKQSDEIEKNCRICVQKRPDEFGTWPFYIFAHKRTIPLEERISLFKSGSYKSIEDVPSHRIIWQPRLKKPKAEENSMLFRYYPKVDYYDVVWIIPDQFLWEEYEKGKMLQSAVVVESISRFKKNKESLEAPLPDEPSEDEARRIYEQISYNNRKATSVP